MGALQNIMAWAKGHPLIAGAIVLAVGALAYIVSKASPKSVTNTTAAEDAAGGAGAGGGASDMTGLPVISPDLSGIVPGSSSDVVGGGKVSKTSTFSDQTDSGGGSFANVLINPQDIQGAGWSYMRDQYNLMGLGAGGIAQAMATPLQEATGSGLQQLRSQYEKVNVGSSGVNADTQASQAAQGAGWALMREQINQPRQVATTPKTGLNTTPPVQPSTSYQYLSGHGLIP